MSAIRDAKSMGESAPAGARMEPTAGVAQRDAPVNDMERCGPECEVCASLKVAEAKMAERRGKP